MKIIDLLNKIANGEEVPKKIKIDNRLYYEYYENIDYKSKDGTYLFDTYIQINKEDMNIEVESLEEKKIPEKLEICKIDDETISGLRKSINVLNEDITSKINEIIDYVNKR